MAFASSLREGMGIPWKRGRLEHRTGGACPEKRPGILTQRESERNLPKGECRLVLALLVGTLACAPHTAWGRDAEGLVLVVQPPAWALPGPAPDAAPLAALIARATGRPVTVEQAPDTLSHWRALRAAQGGRRMALEEAHFAAWRIRRRGFVALARDAAEARFAVVVRPGTPITAPSDLSARPVAVPAPPALAALRLLELYPAPGQEPSLVPARGREVALDALAGGRVDAVVLALGARESVADASVALVTDASPGRGLTVSPGLAAELGTVIQRVLTGAGASAQGRAALAALGLEAVVPASDGVFEDSERLLRGTWGYRDGP